MECKSKIRQLNNKGFSLVELIVIMIIIVVLATSVVVAFVNTSDQKVKASSTLISKYMDNVLNSAMTKGKAWVQIRYDSKKQNYYVADSDGHSEKLSSGVDVTYRVENGDEKNVPVKNVPIDDSNLTENEGSAVETDDENDPVVDDGLILSFDRVNGAFDGIIKEVNKNTGDFVYDVQGDSNSKQYVEYIYIKSGDSMKKIHLYTKTGVYEIED